jgi:acyl carrier protein
LNDACSVSEIADALRHLIVDLSNNQLMFDDIDPKQHMMDGGYIDSLSAVILLARVEEIWSVEVDDRCLLGSACTIDGLAVLIDQGGQ